ncbi:MAG: SUMF1/EgtB/PvdO family nonheme iron enzyme [Chloracidobacterium sp.]|nr:SUMF1/EgtB/PvdO family nonheme iron enzyme [Chloracidobacterium sp.]
MKFCRRCGQSLVHSESDPVTDTVCCTRCGARATKGERVCRQCGASAASSAPGIVMGACYHCGASWRNGWLFCKTCGIDRDHALLLPNSMPAGSKSARDANGSEAEELPEIARVSCKRCGALAKPFSRYCETCGNTLDLSKGVPPKEPAEDQNDSSVITGKLTVPPVAAVFRTQADLPTGSLQSPLSNRSQRSLEPFRESSRAGSKTAAVNGSPATDFRPANGSPSAKSPGSNTEAAKKPFEHTAPRGRTEQLVERSDSRGAILVWIIIATLGVGAGLVAWRLWTNQKNLSRAHHQAPQQSQPPGASPQASPALKQATGPAGMIFVSGGTFKMGRDGGAEVERPAHIVEVNPFFIDRNEVTNEEYQHFVSATNRRAPAHWVGGVIPSGQLKYPVVNVTWNDASAYARWSKKRLPTEAEWEFAARGTDGRLYPWGKEWIPNLANAGMGKNGRVVETGRYALGASPFGALDMSGNVWEWTASDFKDYPGHKIHSLLSGAGLKVIRGGAYDVDVKNVTTTYRGAVSPDRAYNNTGFRCARDAK